MRGIMQRCDKRIEAPYNRCMYYYEVAPQQIVRPGQDVFTYSSTASLERGTIVEIPVGKKSMIGVVMKPTVKPSFDTKPITQVVHPTPLPDQIVSLSEWIHQYYAAPLSNVLQTILPRGIQKKRRLASPSKLSAKRDRTHIVFNKEQSEVIETITSSPASTHMLQGITGSGKTEVYIDLTKQTLARDKSAIILVPEIALTSQIIADFAHHFPTIMVVHSTMTEAERHVTWQRVLESTEPVVVIGARSALFAPIKDLGLIVVDECHEPSYKQEQSPRYSALRVASVLGKLHGSHVVFGSATPLVADRYLAEASGSSILKLTKPARADTVAPTVQIVDLTKRENFNGHRFLSKQLIAQIDATLAEGKQILLFHNRRGSASTTLCENCGWSAQCPRCFVPLTLHADQHQLRCHICNHTERVPSSCPVCHHADIIHKGFGTKLIEAELRKRYPSANIARFDADNKDSETVNARYDDLYRGVIDIAIGTQVVAKGLDLPNLRTVGVIQADSGLALPDFGSDERTFQLLAQVVGRVGRNHHATSVIVQTYQPSHPSIVYGTAQDYDAFYEHALASRRHASFPPFTHLLKLTTSYKTEAASIRAAQSVAAAIKQHSGGNVTILGPTPAFYERQRDSYRWQLTLKSTRREHLIEALTHVPAGHWQSELDPSSLL